MNTIITIARQYGSGGRRIGTLVSEELGCKFYDRELITMAAQKSDMCTEAVESADEKPANSLLYTLAMGSTSMLHGTNYTMPINDRLFLVQSEIIRDIAKEGPCVIVGRCADYVLRDNPRCVRVFVYADLKVRTKRVAERGGISEDEALDIITKTDRRRANYYNFYAGKKWGALSNYNLAVDSSTLGIEKTANLICDFVKRFEQ